MSVYVTYLASCDRCGETEEMNYPDFSPDGDALPPTGWKRLAGIALEEANGGDTTDICETCIQNLTSWINDGRKNFNRG